MELRLDDGVRVPGRLARLAREMLARGEDPPFRARYHALTHAATCWVCGRVLPDGTVVIEAEVIWPAPVTVAFHLWNCLSAERHSCGLQRSAGRRAPRFRAWCSCEAWRSRWWSSLDGADLAHLDHVLHALLADVDHDVSSDT